MTNKHGIDYSIETTPKHHHSMRLIWYVTYSNSALVRIRMICGTKQDAIKYVKSLKPSDIYAAAYELPYVAWNWDEPGADIYHDERGTYKNDWSVFNAH